MTPADHSYEIVVDGRSVPARAGQTVAAALIASGRRSWRTTRRGKPRGLFCGIGVCYDCLVTVDGQRSVRACVAEAGPGDAAPAGRGVAPGSTAAGDTTYDVAVIGAGPAGLAAATTAAGHGLRIMLLDAGSRPGGQYYRHHDSADADGHGSGFRQLRRSLDEHVAAGRITYLARHAVWRVEGGTQFDLYATDEAANTAAANTATSNTTDTTAAATNTTDTTVGNAATNTTEGSTAAPRSTAADTGVPSSRCFRADSVVVATGAYDRPVPFPGWDLPGVLAAGGAQALWKGSRVLGGRRVVIAGSGPFLLPVAAGLAGAGAQVLGVYEAARARGYLRHARVLARHPARFAEAASYAWQLARHRIPYRTGHAVIAAYGTGRLERVTIARLDPYGRPVPDTDQDLHCDTLAVGHGFVPQLDIPVELGCDVRLDATGSPTVDVDKAQQTSVAGVYTAGETTGVGGAALAQVEGELAGHAVAAAAGRKVDPSRLGRLRSTRSALVDFATVLGRVHRAPDQWPATLPDETLVCRCEEVSAGTVRRAVTDLGATDLRGVKLLTRVGMGWCQGRICGPCVVPLTAHLTGRQPDAADLLALVRRPFAQPVRLGTLARLDLPADHDPDPDQPTADQVATAPSEGES